MFDPLGLKEGMSHDPLEPVAAESASSASKQKRLWAVLLILDTVFLLIFGGSLAGMVYLRWSHPASQVIARQAIRRAEPKKTAPAAVAAAPAAPAPKTPEPAPKAEEKRPSPAKAAPKEKPAPKTERAKGPLGSPSVLAPELPRRQASPSGSQESAAASPPETRAAAPGKARPAGKAKPVEFTCDAPNATVVKLKGPFLVKTGGFKKMVKGSDGIWRATISLLPGNYRYAFVVDGVKSKPQTVEVE